MLKKNWFLEVVPTQSVHRSCSMEKETREGETRVDLVEGTKGIGILTPTANSLRIIRLRNFKRGTILGN